MKPFIGIPGNNLTQQSPRYEGWPLSYTPQGFVEGVQNAGGTPIILPISSATEAKEYVSRIDGLVLAGGQDVSPLLFGEEPSLKLGETSPERDVFEVALIQEAFQQNKPILAVCRGIQILNVAFGGTLYQDLSDYPELAVQHIQQTNFDTGAHSIDIAPSSRLSTVMGSSRVVNTFHHQAIKDLAEPFVAVAWSKDGLIEAIEAKDPDRNVLGVQWHPELMIHQDPNMQQLFNDFLQQVEESKKASTAV